jgi:hypothetical protein
MGSSSNPSLWADRKGGGVRLKFSERKNSPANLLLPSCDAASFNGNDALWKKEGDISKQIGGKKNYIP